MAATDDKVGSSSSSSSSSRRCYGRKKIAMKKIEKDSSLRVTFSKRRAGLFKKASELSLLCGAEVAVITFSPGGKLFSFGNPSAEAIIDRYMGGLVQGGQVVERPEVEATGGNQFWWEVPESELERMELTELESYGGELERFINKLRFRVMMESGSDDSGSNASQPGTWSTANSDILDIERMMMEEASVPECDNDDGFDWSFVFGESPNPSSVEDDSAACFNESVPAETSSSSAAYTAWAASPECNNSFSFDNNSSNWNWGFGFHQNPLEDSGWCFNQSDSPIPIPAAATGGFW